jgi:hypothetical protein
MLESLSYICLLLLQKDYGFIPGVSPKEESQQEFLLVKGQIRACDVHVDICTISSKQKL